MYGKISNLQDVVDWGLCTGCGACLYACKDGGVTLTDIENEGLRPRFENGCAGCQDCLEICPGNHVNGSLETGGLPSAAEAEFGASLEIWEGYASDPEIRYKGSSGGLITALSLFCLEQRSFELVLHSGMDPDEPWKNTTVVSQSRQQLMSRTGSRYAPSSPCAGLGEIARASGPCVFVGKPCDTSAVAELRRRDSDLDRRLGLVLTFFCAGTPSTQGSLNLIASMGVPKENVDEVHYRGEGWPGNFRVIYGDKAKNESLSYQESWSQLTPFRSLRCNLCPDGLGRVADISCGDAWQKFDNNPDDCGRSLVIVRTQRGREILRAALRSGYVTLHRVGPEAVLAAQKDLLTRRRQLFGRLLGLRALGIPVPRFENFSLLRSWRALPLKAQARSVLGTIRRALVRGWWRPRARTAGEA